MSMRAEMAGILALLLLPGVAAGAAGSEPSYEIETATPSVSRTVSRQELIAELERRGVPADDADVLRFLSSPVHIEGLDPQDPRKARSIRLETRESEGAMRPALIVQYRGRPDGDLSMHVFFPRTGDPPSYPAQAYLRFRLVGGEILRLTHVGPAFEPSPVPGEGGGGLGRGGGLGGSSSIEPPVGRGPIAPRVDSYNYGLAGADQAEADSLRLNDFWGSRDSRSPEYYRLYRRNSEGGRTLIGTVWRNRNGQSYLNLHSGTVDPETGVEVHGSFIPFHGRNYRGSERTLAHADGWDDLNHGWVTQDGPGRATYRQAHLIPAGYTSTGERLYRVRGLANSEQATFTVETVSPGYFRIRMHSAAAETHSAPDSQGQWEASRQVKVGPPSRGIAVTMATYQGRQWVHNSEGNLLSPLPIRPGASFQRMTVGGREVYAIPLEGEGPYHGYHLVLDGTTFRFVETAWDRVVPNTDSIRSRHRFTHAPPGAPGGGPYAYRGGSSAGPGSGESGGGTGGGATAGGGTAGGQSGGPPGPAPREDDWGDWWPLPKSLPKSKPKPSSSRDTTEPLPLPRAKPIPKPMPLPGSDDQPAPTKPGPKVPLKPKYDPDGMGVPNPPPKPPPLQVMRPPVQPRKILSPGETILGLESLRRDWGLPQNGPLPATPPPWDPSKGPMPPDYNQRRSVIEAMRQAESAGQQGNWTEADRIRRIVEHMDRPGGFLPNPNVPQDRAAPIPGYDPFPPDFDPGMPVPLEPGDIPAPGLPIPNGGPNPGMTGPA